MPKDDSLDQWHEVLRGKKALEGTDPSVVQEALLLRETIVRQAPSEDSSSVDIEAALSAAATQAAAEGLQIPAWLRDKQSVRNVVQLSARRAVWYRRPELAIAATLVIAIGVGMQVYHQEARNADEMVERGDSSREERTIPAENPQQRAREIAEAFSKAGMQVRVFESMGLWIVDIKIKPEQIVNASRIVERLEIGGPVRGDLRILVNEK